MYVMCFSESVTGSLFTHTKRLYELFKTQHINDRMTEDQCDSEILTRNILDKNKECKEKNTFILSDSETVKFICNRPDSDRCRSESQDSDRCRSESQFEIIDCELMSKTEKTPPCRYNGKHQFKKRIEVSCKGGYPVHYYRAF
uniref:Ribonuclease A-domain domain-containing protein n=1 Tax=Pundamilia nyererei TaxID=303518 RepID=A0A3B4HAX0_9CICH